MATIRRSTVPGWAWDMICAVERGERIEVEWEWRVRNGNPAVRRYGHLLDSGSERVREWASDRIREGAASYSSGRCYYEWPTTRIVVTAGTDEMDARMVLLHELAHVVAGPRAHHGPKWRRTALRLYRRYGGAEVVAHAAEHERRKRLVSAAQSAIE